MRSGALAATGLLVTLALAACNAGTKQSSSAATTSASGTESTSSTGSTGTGTSPAGTGTGTSSASAGTGGAAAATSQTTTSSGAGRGRRGRGKDGKNGLPAAPAGLVQTTGYATYERCQGSCSGSVPTALRRPLDLPADDGGPCPIAVNVTGPVSPLALPAGVGFRRVSGSQWLDAEVTWTAAGSYTGPLLIRGGMVGGGALGFGAGAVPYDELQLLDAGLRAPRVTAGGRAWVTDTRIRGGGCYAYQVDGTDFSEVIVFRAIA
jgi:hypothetical protein